MNIDKQQFKNVMEPIQMSETCEQKILAAAHTATRPVQKARSRFSFSKKAGIALAAAISVSVVSVCSVAAAQNLDLLQILFPQTETTTVAETAVQTNGSVEQFQVTGMDGMTITPIGVVNDAKCGYLMMQVVAEDGMDLENMILTNTYDPATETAYPLINGESADRSNLLDDDGWEISLISQEDGTYLLTYFFVFQEEISFDSMEFTIGLTDITEPVQTQDGYTEAGQGNPLGTISATLELGTNLECKTYDFAEPVSIGDAQMTHMDLTSFRLICSGTGIMDTTSYVGDFKPGIILHMADGSTVSTQHFNAEQEYFGSNKWGMNFIFDASIDPEEVVSVQFGDVTVPLA